MYRPARVIHICFGNSSNCRSTCRFCPPDFSIDFRVTTPLRYMNRLLAFVTHDWSTLKFFKLDWFFSPCPVWSLFWIRLTLAVVINCASLVLSLIKVVYSHFSALLFHSFILKIATFAISMSLTFFHGMISRWITRCFEVVHAANFACCTVLCNKLYNVTSHKSIRYTLR